MLNKTFFKHIILIDQALFSAISFGLTIVLGRALGLAQFGLFSSLIILLFLFSGISQAIIVQPMQTKVKFLKEKNGYAKMLFSVQLIFGLFILILGLPLSLLTTNHFDLSVNDIMCFSIYASLFIAFDFLRKYFLSIGANFICFKMDLFYGATMAITFVLLFLFSLSNLALVFPLLLIGLLPPLVFGILQFYKYAQGKTAWSLLKVQLKEGKWYLFASISQWFSSNIFVLASGVFLSIEALGALRLVQTVFGLFNILLQSVENFIIPKVNLILEVSQAEAIKFISELLKRSFIWLSAALALLFIFSSDVIVLFGGKQFKEYHEIVRGFTFLYALIFLFYPVRILIRAKGYHKSFFIAYLISGVIGAFTCNYFFEIFAVQGAIIGLALGQITLFITWVIVLQIKKIKIWKLYTSY